MRIARGLRRLRVSERRGIVRERNARPVSLASSVVEKSDAESRKRSSTDGSTLAAIRVIQANRDFYHEIASKYDSYDGRGFGSYLQQLVKADLNRIGSSLGSSGRTPHCLDCGGGTGNLALEVLDKGWKLTVVDVSPEMLNILRKKATARGYCPTLINSSIEQFLGMTRDVYDLVCFSSVLHHLYCYDSVVQRASSCIRNGGYFYSICDPVIPRHPFWSCVVDTIDVTVAKVRFDTTDVLPGIGRRLRKLFCPKDASFGRVVVTPGDIAEYHARSGIDDKQILFRLQKNGFTILEHTRFATGRSAPIRVLNEWARLSESFKIIARRDSRQGEGEVL
jgi:ubiquinone/menaquinone biosynthesis C-methylase UbiE